MDPTELFEGHPVARSVYERIRSCLVELGSFEVRASKSQIAFWRKRGFAYLWRPGQYLLPSLVHLHLGPGYQRPRSTPDYLSSRKRSSSSMSAALDSGVMES